MDNTQKVIQTIDKKHQSSNGSCGTLIPDMAFATGLDYEILNLILRKLYSEKYFCLKDGINGKMIFKN